MARFHRNQNSEGIQYEHNDNIASIQIQFRIDILICLILWHICIFYIVVTRLENAHPPKTSLDTPPTNFIIATTLLLPNEEWRGEEIVKLTAA